MRYFFLLFILLLTSCQPSEKELSGDEILQKSKQKHDPNGEWSESEFTLRIQEPRVGNAARFSLVYLNNKNNAFKLLRNRGDKIASYGVNAEGITTILLDNQSVEDSLMIQKYMLQPQRVSVYKRSYQTMLGLPMSLNNDLISNIESVSKVVFNNIEAYKVQLKLSRTLFSDNWNVYFSTSDFTLLGIDLVDDADALEGERLYFDKSIQIGSMSLPRMKHWYDLKDNYLGSDVIVKDLDKE